MSKKIGKSIEELLGEAMVPEEEQPHIIPDNWLWVKLGAIGEIGSSKRVMKSSWQRDGVPFYRAREIVRLNQDLPIKDPIFISEELYQEIKLKYGVPRVNDLLITGVGTIGETYIVSNRNEFYFKDGNVIWFKNIWNLNVNYLNYYLKSNNAINQIKKMSAGTTVDTYTISNANKTFIPLPPLNEQKRIADKVEILLDKINQAKQLIEEARDTFELRRAAILDKAFRGELTLECRKEDSSLSIVRIDSKIPIAEHPHSLPKGWKWALLEDVCEKITDGTHHSPKSYAVGDYKYVTAKNIKLNGLNLDNITYVSSEAHREIHNRCDVKYRDVLYIKDGATTGIATMNYLEEEFSLLSSVGLLRAKKNVLEPEYLMYSLNSPSMKNRMLDMMSGIAIRRLTLTKIKKGIIPVPPIEEQKIIVSIISKMITLDNKALKMIRLQNKIELLKQSVLSKAFRGELGTSDIFEENAKELIKQIIQGDTT